jgi:NifB/MoaA-like Fe-S oxidoreductase
LAIKPKNNQTSQIKHRKSLKGTIMTGEMFAPVLEKEIAKLNDLIGSEFYVMAVPNTYFGGDVSVAGLLSGQDFLAVKNQVKGGFVIIPENVIKSDEPILIDGMQFEELKSKYDVPIYDVDLKDFVWEFLL